MTKTLAAVVVLVAVVLGACAQPPVPQDRFYRLQVAPPDTGLAAPRLDGMLEVDRFAADGLFAGRPIVYSDASRSHEVTEYHYHFWTEPPPSMLRDQLVEYLRAAGVARTVVTPEMRVEPDFVLAGKIKRLEQVVGAPPRAAVSLELGLRRGATGELLLLRTYAEEVTAGAPTVSAAVLAVNEALARIYAKFITDLSRL